MRHLPCKSSSHSASSSLQLIVVVVADSAAAYPHLDELSLIDNELQQLQAQGQATVTCKSVEATVPTLDVLIVNTLMTDRHRLCVLLI